MSNRQRPRPATAARDPGQPARSDERPAPPDVPYMPTGRDAPSIRLSYLAAPTLLFAYGVAHLIDGLDGSYGPGPAWTIGHACFLAALLLFGVVLFTLRMALAPGARRKVATVAAVAGTAGLLVFVRSILIDLIVGARATDRADMNRIYPQYDRWPAHLPQRLISSLQGIGPALFIIGLLTLTVLLAVTRPRPLPWWSPLLVATGFAAITVNLNLLSVGAAALLAALAPMRRQQATHRNPAGQRLRSRQVPRS